MLLKKVNIIFVLCLLAIVCAGKCFADATPVIILKLDDVTYLSDNWSRCSEFLVANNVKASYGIIGYSLETDKPSLFSWINDLHTSGMGEFWNHGYMNRSSEDPEGEFESDSVEDQLWALQRTQQLAQDKLGITLNAFGPHWSSTNENTIEALKQVPEIKSVFYYTGEEDNDWFVFERFYNMEYPTFVPDFDYVKSWYEADGYSKPYLCLQGHPNQWTEERWENFQQIVLYFKAQGCTFMTASEYLGIATEPDVVNEAEEMEITYDGNWVAITDNTSASNGQYVRFSSSSEGDWVEFVLPSLAAGVYDLNLIAQEHSYAGIYQMQVNGVDVGEPIDYYSASTGFNDFSFNDVNITSSSKLVVRFVNTGQNTAAAGAVMMVDAFEWKYVTEITYEYECEDLSYTFDGDWASLTSSSAASNGSYIRFSGSSVGDWINFTVPALPAGDYKLDVDAFLHSYVGIYQLQVDGVDVGDPVDFYSSSSSLETFTFNGIQSDGINPLEICFINIGENVDALSSRLMIDTLTLSPAAPEVYEGEFEDMTETYYNGQYATYDNTSASGGAYARFTGYGSGAWVEYTIADVQQGTYTLTLGVLDHEYAGIYQLQINGVDVGEPIDFYTDGGAFNEYSISGIDIDITGDVDIAFVCTGKNSSALGYRIFLDNFILTP